MYLEAALEEAEKQFVQDNKGDMKTRHALGRKVQGEGCLPALAGSCCYLSSFPLAEIQHVCCLLCRRLTVCRQHSSIVGGMVVHNYALVFSHTTVTHTLYGSLNATTRS